MPDPAPDPPTLLSQLQDAGEIHLWFCTFDADTTAVRQRALAQTWLHEVLSTYLGRRIDASDLTRGEFGKPSLARDAGLAFNLSHSHTAAVVALGDAVELGVDLESPRRERPWTALAERYFCPTEAVRLAALPDAALPRAFLALWTAKEAVLKALGRGLAFGLHRLEFRLDATGQPQQLVAISPLAGNAGDWQVHGFEFGAGWLGHVAWPGSARRLRQFHRDPQSLP